MDPTEIPRLLPYIWLLEVLTDPRRYKYRLQGTKLVEWAGSDFTWALFDEAHERSPNLHLILGRLDATVDQALITHSRSGIILMSGREHMTIESIVAPLWGRDGSVTRVFALSVVKPHRLGP